MTDLELLLQLYRTRRAAGTRHAAARLHEARRLDEQRPRRHRTDDRARNANCCAGSKRGYYPMADAERPARAWRVPADLAAGRSRPIRRRWRQSPGLLFEDHLEPMLRPLAVRPPPACGRRWRRTSGRGRPLRRAWGSYTAAHAPLPYTGRMPALAHDRVHLIRVGIAGCAPGLRQARLAATAARRIAASRSRPASSPAAR